MRQNLTWGLMLLPETCSSFMENNEKAFTTAKGSSAVHQAYTGGYEDHLDEVFGIAGVLFWQLDDLRPLPFTLSDAILVLWLHDIEKVWKYSGVVRPLTNAFLAKTDKQALTEKIVGECRLELNEEHWNALRYVHGEPDEEYVSGEAKAGPLAAFVHMCDYWSARGWPDEPMKSGYLARQI